METRDKRAPQNVLVSIQGGGVPSDVSPPHDGKVSFKHRRGLNSLLAFVPSPTKITLIGAVLFALQQTHYLPLQTRHLMLIYTIFTVVNKVSPPLQDKDREEQIFCFVSVVSRLPHDLPPSPVLKF